MSNEELCVEITSILSRLVVSDDDMKLIDGFCKTYVFDQLRILNSGPGNECSNEIKERYKAYYSNVIEKLRIKQRDVENGGSGFLTMQESMLLQKIDDYTKMAFEISNKIDNQGKGSNKEKVRTDGKLHINSDDIQMNGYALSTIVIVLTTLLGFILSVVLLYLK